MPAHCRWAGVSLSPASSKLDWSSTSRDKYKEKEKESDLHVGGQGDYVADGEVACSSRAF